MRRDSDRLLERFAAGDADAFVTFYRLHLPAILGCFQRRTLAADYYLAGVVANALRRCGKPVRASDYIAGDRMIRSRPHLVTGLALAAIGLAACGDSKDSSADTLTRAEYIAKTDALCKQSNARTRRLNAQLRERAAGAADDTELLRRLAPILERGYGPVRDNAAAFQAANPPPSDAAAVERIRALYDRQAEFVRKLALAAKRDDSNAFRALSEEQKDVVTRARRIARRFGFKECGSTRSDAA